MIVFGGGEDVVVMALAASLNVSGGTVPYMLFEVVTFDRDQLGEL